MRTKNALALTPQESAHLARVKALPCSFCDGWGGYAHHPRQGDHFTAIATCWECHQGARGIHGDQTLMLVYGRDELTALNITHARLNGSRIRPERERERGAGKSSKILPRRAA